MFRGCLQANYTKPPLAGFGGPIARCDVNPLAACGASVTGGVPGGAKTAKWRHFWFMSPPQAGIHFQTSRINLYCKRSSKTVTHELKPPYIAIRIILDTALSLSISSVPASLVVVAVVLSFTSRRRRLCRARICPFYLSGLQLTSFSLARLTLLYNKDLV